MGVNVDQSSILLIVILTSVKRPNAAVSAPRLICNLCPKKTKMLAS